MNQSLRADAIILAAGRGKRMGSDLPKVLHPVADRPMIHWVIDACRDAGFARCVLVVGFGGDEVRRATRGLPGIEIDFAEQPEPKGTGHAAQMAEPNFADASPEQVVVVLNGDMPLLRATVLRRLIDLHEKSGAAATLATAFVDDPTGYGRVLRDEAGQFRAIVEQKDASPQELAVREINPGYYCFSVGALFEGLKHINNQNAQGEFYLTDVPTVLLDRGQTVELLPEVTRQDVMGVNSPEQLADVDRVMRQRLADPPRSTGAR